MFKLSLCLIAVVLVCVQANNLDKNAETLRYVNDPSVEDGTYNFAYESSNGIQQQEAGNPNGVAGSFSFIGDDGNSYTVQYTADENGFHPTGDHLPTPPPIPEQIIRSLEYNRLHPSEN